MGEAQPSHTAAADDDIGQRPLATARRQSALRKTLWRQWQHGDPRYPVAVILGLYVLLGCTVLGFNRNPYQVLVTILSACGLEVLLGRLFRRQWVVPLSALITSFSLAILLNYAHGSVVLLAPVFFAIGSKYLVTFDGRHVLNPALAGVTLSLLLTNELVTAAPAYQWYGIASMGAFIAMLGVVIVLPRIDRTPLVVSFLVCFTLQTALRGWLLRYHLPFATLFLGTLSAPSFFLFTFFMITDPMTSPRGRCWQVVTGCLLAGFDFAYHLRQSYFTFFYAAFTLGGLRWLGLHTTAMLRLGNPWVYLYTRAIASQYYHRPTFLGLLALTGAYASSQWHPGLQLPLLTWSMQAVPASHSGLSGEYGGVIERLDPRVQHMGKWLTSVGDAIAVGDWEGSGRPGLFVTQALKRPQDRLVLYRNTGDLRFVSVDVPALHERRRDLERYGLGTNAMFVDYDGDGDLDLFITYAFGTPVLLHNALVETGVATWIEVTQAVGLQHNTNAIAATWLDLNRDGRLDLVIANVWPYHLPDYSPPQPLNLFRLPAPAYPGDTRMFNFMHASWNNADNGGVLEVWLQDATGRFAPQDRQAWGLTETRWSLAIGTGDFNQDGWTDLYVANDFGPDELLYNQHGTGFRSIKGAMFGSVGRDSYKGMNVSVADMDRNGWQDIYVSNVHHALQAEGSLLWMFAPGRQAGAPHIEDRAAALGALNEHRFGWGAALQDFDNDGWVDIAQANGMVDDSIDKRYDSCPDYWYVNAKLAQAPPSYHRYIHRWGDIRGQCIYGQERNRLLLNQGNTPGARFIDAAAALGMTAHIPSRAAVAADLDNDGRLELLFSHPFAGPTLYRNTLSPTATGADANWIGVQLASPPQPDSVACNHMALGSLVTLTTTEHGQPVTQQRELTLVNGLLAQNDLRLHFGLGRHTDPMAIRVTWCGVTEEWFPALPVNRYHTLVRGTGVRPKTPQPKEQP